MTREQLQEASDTFYSALVDVLAGDATRMQELWSQADDVSYLGPGGELLIGGTAVQRTWMDQAMAKFGGHATPEELHLVVAGPLGIVVGYERGVVQLDGQESALEIRATSTYRLEDGAVKMIGHHTDRF